ncbi:hypothetical protein FJTKL_04199 [Diaporthe vaccinii]|uniref:Uncharacterized protein n=1 Tax=Diaporthe vaccinii TaxID=105482 RepID=A0ABR4DTE4_9PEZI
MQFREHHHTLNFLLASGARVRVLDSASSCCALNSSSFNVIASTERLPAHVVRLLSAPAVNCRITTTWRQSHRGSLIAYRNGLNIAETQDSN